MHRLPPSPPVRFVFLLSVIVQRRIAPYFCLLISAKRSKLFLTPQNLIDDDHRRFVLHIRFKSQWASTIDNSRGSHKKRWFKSLKDKRFLLGFKVSSSRWIFLIVLLVWYERSTLEYFKFFNKITPEDSSTLADINFTDEYPAISSRFHSRHGRQLQTHTFSVKLKRINVTSSVRIAAR